VTDEADIAIDLSHTDDICTLPGAEEIAVDRQLSRAHPIRYRRSAAPLERSSKRDFQSLGRGGGMYPPAHPQTPFYFDERGTPAPQATPRTFRAIAPSFPSLNVTRAQRE